MSSGGYPPAGLPELEVSQHIDIRVAGKPRSCGLPEPDLADTSAVWMRLSPGPDSANAR